MAIGFQLFAPYNQAVSLLGCFSKWRDIPMQKGQDGYFRTEVELSDGLYEYKFRLQSRSPDRAKQWVEVIDPYATDVDEVRHTGLVRVKDGQRLVDDYVWEYDHVPLPQNFELIIYEMHIADFSGGEDDPERRGKYQDAIAKLDYLQDLGINAIELMPVNEYPGDYSWGYKVRHFFAAESSYGSTADLKQFVDQCHGRGIRVFVDGIYNHTDEECPLLLIDRNTWYYEHKHYPEDPQNYWGPEFNYDAYDEKLDLRPAWKFIGDVVRYWVKEYHIDGIRYDAVRQLANFEFLEWLAREAKTAAAPKPFYNIAEHIPDTHKVVEPQGPLDACWHESFRYFVLPHLYGEMFDLDRLKEVLDPKRQGYGTATNVINYLATHDRERLLRELGDRGIFDQDAFERAKLGATLLLTAVGIPMIWMGEEFGEHKRKSEKVTQPKKIAWPLLQKELNQDLFNYYQSLIQLRKTNLALQSDNIDFIHEDCDAKVFGYQRWHDQGDRVAIVINFSDQRLEGYRTSNFATDPSWLEWTTRTKVEIRDNQIVTDLQRWSANIFISQK
uniref:Alpha amylase catalytic region n=1 Tax=Cyanothece sp. (strain PCC 7425 / ATCC 29141) TaxID=395961 RepID=B8HU06_CYAP4